MVTVIAPTPYDPAPRRRVPSPILLFLTTVSVLWLISIASCLWTGLRTGDWDAAFQPISFPFPFMDLFCYLGRFQQLHTSAFFHLGGKAFPWNYPAPCALVYRFLYSLLPSSVRPETLDLASGLSLLNPLTFTVLPLVLLSLALLVRSLRRAGLRTRSAVLVAFLTALLSWPLFFALQRGNIEVLLWVPMLAGLWAIGRHRPTLGACLIGFGSAFKLYPVVLLALLLPRRRFRALASGIAVFLLTSWLSLLWLGPTVAIAFASTRAGVAHFVTQYTLFFDPIAIGYDHSLFGIYKSFVPAASAASLAAASSAYLVIAGLVTATIFFTIVVHRPWPNQLLFVTAASLMLPATSFDYTLLGLYAPFVTLLFLSLAVRTQPRSLLLAFFLFALLLAPETFIASKIRIFGGQLKALALLGLCTLAAAVPFPQPGERAHSLRLNATMPRLLLLLLALSLHALAQTPDATPWPTYGGDAGGQRFSPADQITPANVAQLGPAWTYHTHALASTNHAVRFSDFEATPVLLGSTLYLTTPFDRVIALDAATGAERWTFDPHLADDIEATNYTSRGVALWSSPSPRKNQPCDTRVLFGTLDARLFAIDAHTGQPCEDFGTHGQVDLKQGVPTNPDRPFRFFGNTSPPTVVGNVAVIGSAIGDNQAVEVEPGVVRGFDVISGKLLWSFDPWRSSPQPHTPRTGGSNTWGVISADLEHGLVFLPTGSPSPDFFGGLRPGDDRDANSVVALDARSGRRVWAFQLIHHDLWDYDVAAEPLLFNLHNTTPAVAVTAKTGSLFVLNRLTGEPLFPVTERPVPASDVPGEQASPTQPFSSLPPLTRQSFQPADLAGHTAADVQSCQAQLKGLRYEGIYTPPSLQGTIQYPGSLGGVNWSSMAMDPTTNILYANINGSAYEIRLLRRSHPHRRAVRLMPPVLWTAAALLFLFAAARRRTLWPGAFPAVVVLLLIAGGLALEAWLHPPAPAAVGTRAGHAYLNSPDAIGEISPQNGTPFRIYRRVLQDDHGLPCTPTPWGATVAIDLNTGTRLWEQPLGSMLPPPAAPTGTGNFGAPIVTGSGLLFTAASRQPLLRALDARTGRELWQGQLPVPAQSTPMTYSLGGRQYVVVCAGGHGGIGTPLGDSVVAFALPKH